MREQREQLLFVVVLLLVGWLSYSRLQESYRPVVVRSSESLAAAELVVPASVRLGGLPEAVSGDRERSIFEPPRELLPLDPLQLPDAPIPPLPVRRPSVLASLGGAAARVYRVPTESLGSLSLPDVDDGGADDGSSTGGDVDQGGGSFAGLEDDDEVAPEAVYDFLTPAGLRRIYGSVENDDPHGLADRPDEPIVFRQISLSTGRPIGFPIEHERQEIEEWGLARTFENETIERSRSMGRGPGSVAARREFVFDLLNAADDEPEALAYAAAEAEAALAEAGQDAGTARLLAGVLRRAHDLDGELAVYRAAEAGGWADAALLVDYADWALGMGLDERAQELLEQAKAFSRTSAEVRWLEGRLAERAGDHATALASYKAASQTPFQPPFADERRHGLGLDTARMLLATGRATEAAREAERVLASAPELPAAHVMLGAARQAEGDGAAASSAYADAMAAAPHDGDVLTDAALVAWSSGDGPGARRLAERAIDVDPVHATRALLVLGFLHEDAGQPQEARDLYAAALELDPGHAHALYLMGRLQRMDGDAEGATSTLRRSLRWHGPETLLLGELGHAALELDQPSAAARYFREALRAEPDNGRLTWLLGLAKLAQGDVGGAIDSLTRATTLDEPGAHAALGAALYALGDEQGALQNLDELARALAGQDDDPSAAWGVAQAARIRDNLSKRQWLDRFRRSSLQRGWSERVWDGSPRVFLDGEGVRIQGRMEATREDDRPGIQRPVEGRGFYSAEASTTARGAVEGRRGLALTYRQAKGVLGRLPKARLDIWVDPDGSLRASILDGFDNVVRDGMALDGLRIAPDARVSLGVERLDLVSGQFQFLVDGRRVGEPFTVKALRNFDKNLFDLEVYAEAAPGRSVDVGVDLVRIVREP